VAERTVVGDVTTVCTLAGSVWGGVARLEVYRLSGEFLGEVGFPDGMQVFPRPYFDGDDVLIAAELEDGTPVVRLLELVGPVSD
jgi:hypothetical protein